MGSSRCFQCFEYLAQKVGKKIMKNWFNTLNEALESENLLDSWQIHFSPIAYNETFAYTFQDGTKYGHYVSIFRDNSGKYERPVHYARG